MTATDISFCMIVRNGELMLSDCLKSVARLVDEMIVVDTGSTDASVDIARSFGAKVLSVAWEGDFAAARNVYLKAARCAWVLSLDADEVLGTTEQSALRQVISRHPASAFAFSIRNYFNLSDRFEPLVPSEFAGAVARGVGYTLSRTVRLLPRRRGILYRYPVHESLLPALRKQRVPVRHCKIPIHHVGHLGDAQGRRAKLELYRELGLRKIARHPRYFLGYLELGKIFLHEGEHRKAESLFSQCLRLNPMCHKAYYLSALALRRDHKFAEAHRRLAQGLRLFPRHSDLLYLRGVMELDHGNVIDALNSLAPVLQRLPRVFGRGNVDWLLPTAGPPGGERPQTIPDDGVTRWQTILAQGEFTQ